MNIRACAILDFLNHIAHINEQLRKRDVIEANILLAETVVVF